MNIYLTMSISFCSLILNIYLTMPLYLCSLILNIYLTMSIYLCSLIINIYLTKSSISEFLHQVQERLPVHSSSFIIQTGEVGDSVTRYWIKSSPNLPEVAQKYPQQRLLAWKVTFFLKWRQNQSNIWATFIRKYFAKYFRNSPNLVTLIGDIRKVYVTHILLWREREVSKRYPSRVQPILPESLPAYLFIALSNNSKHQAWVSNHVNVLRL